MVVVLLVLVVLLLVVYLASSDFSFQLKQSAAGWACAAAVVVNATQVGVGGCSRGVVVKGMGLAVRSGD